MDVRYVYVLALEDDCWYVGESENPAARIRSHVSGSGASWTRLHRPLMNPEQHVHNRQRIEGTAIDAKLEEEKQVKKLMLLYGIDKVRGGSYCEVNLTDDCIASLERELCHSDNRCLRCGRQGHYISDCFAKTDVNGERISEQTYSPVRRSRTSDRRSEFANNGTIYRYSMYSQLEYESESESSESFFDEEACHRCGRRGHWAVDCFARTDVHGKTIWREPAYFCKGKGKGKRK